MDNVSIGLRVVSAAVLSGLLAVPAAAAPQFFGPSPYLGLADSPFQGVAGLHLETFEGGGLGVPGVTAVGGVTIGPSTLTDSVDADDGSVDGSGQGGHSFYSGGTATAFRFIFDALVLGGLPTHAGIVWTDVGIASPSTGSGLVSFEAFDAADQSLGSIGPVLLGDGSAGGGTAEDRFFGVQSSGGISSIVISMLNSVDWEVDHLQVAVAPLLAIAEPVSLGLLGFGLVGLGMAARRHR